MIGSWVHAKKEGQGGKGFAPRKRSKRSANFLKLLSLCPIFWHEQREQREQRFKIKDLQRERGAHHVRTIRTRLKSRTYRRLCELCIYAPTWCARLAWCERSERGWRS